MKKIDQSGYNSVYLETCKTALLIKPLELLTMKWKKCRFYKRHNLKNIFTHSLACDSTGFFVKEKIKGVKLFKAYFYTSSIVAEPIQT